MKVELKLLKHFALVKLPPSSALRYVLLAEPERLSPEEFVSRIPVWLALLDHELNSAGTRNLGDTLARRVAGAAASKD